MKTRTPSIVLETKEQTLAWLAEHDELYPDQYSIKSLWLCRELNRFEQEGYVYNTEAQRRICEENGLDLEWSTRRVESKRTKTEGGLLGALVYNAQNYRRVMQLEDAGYVPATLEARTAFAGKRVTALANGDGGPQTVTVKEMGGVLRLVPLRSRKRYLAEYQDLWIKAIA